VVINGVTLRVDSNNCLFQPGETYLLALQRMHDRRVALASVPFHIDGSGAVMPIQVSGGGAVSHPSNLYGMPIDAVIRRLRRE
jgi:hypothetical protein